MTTFQIPSVVLNALEPVAQGEHLADLTKATQEGNVLTLTFVVNEEGMNKTINERLDFNPKNPQPQQMAVALKLVNFCTAFKGPEFAAKVQKSGNLPMKELKAGGRVWVSVVHNKSKGRVFANVERFDEASDSDVAAK